MYPEYYRYAVRILLAWDSTMQQYVKKYSWSFKQIERPIYDSQKKRMF